MQKQIITRPIPEYCDNCASTQISYTENKILYGRNYGEWPMIYFCNDCRASVGCHSQTNKPLGIMADKETKTLRNSAHQSFDILWADGFMGRTQAYQWLARILNITFDNCHISQLSKEQLQITAEYSRTYIENNKSALERRKVKKHAKRANKLEREYRKVKQHIRQRN